MRDPKSAVSVPKEQARFTCRRATAEGVNMSQGCTQPVPYGQKGRTQVSLSHRPKCALFNETGNKFHNLFGT